MVMLRFPFSFPQPSNQPNVISNATTTASRSFSAAAVVAVAAAAGAATFAGIAAAQNLKDSKSSVVENALNSLFSGGSSSLPWGSLSLVDGSASSVVESKTGESFPSVVSGNRRLLGIGLRRKSLLGLKNIDVYAFGVYADNDEVQKCLGKKQATLSASELKQELLEADVCLTVRLQIVYGKLSIRSVRNAFEDSVGSRLQKFGGPDNKEVLQRFTSLFKDEYKIPRGSVIELSRERGHVLRTTIEGKEVGSIESKVLCRSILDLYIGEEPFDKQAKEEIESNLASLLQK
ncbi:Fatty-acid-binding protein 1 [Linum perenne]